MKMNLLLKLAKKLTERIYHIGIIEYEDLESELSPSIVAKTHWIKNSPKTSWYADPFIYKVTDSQIFLFVEEYIYTLRRGVISLVVVNRQTFEFVRSKIILKLETHLSFPYITKMNGETLVIPENYQSGKSNAYVYKEEKEELCFYKELIDEPLTDAIYFMHNGKLHTLSTRIETCNGDTTRLYINKNLSREIQFTDNSARSAGMLFTIKGKVYRPQQDCNDSYGKGIVIYELDDMLNHKEIMRLYPISRRYFDGLHTFNVSLRYIAVDGRTYKYYLIGKCLAWLRSYIRKNK